MSLDFFSVGYTIDSILILRKEIFEIMKKTIVTLLTLCVVCASVCALANGNSPLLGYPPNGATTCFSTAQTNPHQGSVYERCTETPGAYDVWAVPLPSVPTGAHVVSVQVVGPASFEPAMTCNLETFDYKGNLVSGPASVEVPEGVSGVQTVSLGSGTWTATGSGTVFCSMSVAGEELISVTY
jgi:hypothetical protein